MVSWCINTLDVRAPEPWLDAFIATSCLEGGLLRLALVDPPPRRLRPSRVPDWREARWGTALDIDPDDLEFARPDPEHAVWHFHTPITPPSAWVELVGRTHPLLRLVLAYSVPDHGLLGRLEIAEGRQQPAGTWTRLLPSDRLLCAEPGCWLYGDNVTDVGAPAQQPPTVRCFRHRRPGATARPVRPEGCGPTPWRPPVTTTSTDGG